jgi:antitoxin PrlF
MSKTSSPGKRAATRAKSNSRTGARGLAEDAPGYLPGEQATITSKGQTTIPKNIRDFLRLKPGDRVWFSVHDGKVVMRARNRPVTDLKFLLPPPPKGAKTLEEMQEGIRAGALKSAGH